MTRTLREEIKWLVNILNEVNKNETNELGNYRQKSLRIFVKEITERSVIANHS